MNLSHKIIIIDTLFSLNFFLSFYFYFKYLKKNIFLSINVYWFFNLFFMNLNPLFIYYGGNFIQAGEVKNYVDEILFALIILILLNLFINFIYNLKISSLIVISKLKSNNYQKNTLLVLFFSCFLFIAMDSLCSLFTRSCEFDFNNLIVNNIFNYFFRPFLFFILVIIFIEKKSWLIKFFLFSMSLFVLFPLSVSRSLGLIVTITLFYILFFNTKIHNKYSYHILLILSLFLSSSLDGFRRGVELDDLSSISDLITSGHINTFENFVLMLAYTNEHGFSFFSNFIGAILFMIPRTLWDSKPISTDFLITENFISLLSSYGGNQNIGMPLIAEAYFSLGVIGIFLFFILYTIFLKFIDSSFSSNNNIASGILFLPLIIQQFLILRGPIMSSLSFLAGLFISQFLAFYICGYRIYVQK